MRIDQVLATATARDPTTRSALRFRALLPAERRGSVYALEVDPDLAERVRPVRDLVANRSALGPVFVHLATATSALIDAVVSSSRPAAVIDDGDDPTDPDIRPPSEADLARLAHVTRCAMATTAAGAARLAAHGFTAVEVVAPVLDLDRLRLLDPHAPTDHHMQVTRSGPVALYVGQVAPHERIEQLIAAYHVLLSHLRPDVKLVVVGPARSHEYTFALHRQIRELNLPHAWVAGDLDDTEIVALYRNADLFVTAGETTAFVRAAASAMTFELPVLGRRTGGLPDTVGPAALLLDADDGVTVMAEAMAELLTDDRLSASLVGRGKARLGELADATVAARQLELLTEAI